MSKTINKKLFAIVRKVSKDGMKRYVQLYEIRTDENGNSLYDVTIDVASILKEKTKSIKTNSSGAERDCLVLNGCGYDVMQDVCMRLESHFANDEVKRNYNYELL
jgi:hypothetical protein